MGTVSGYTIIALTANIRLWVLQVAPLSTDIRLCGTMSDYTLVIPQILNYVVL
jgi:hypothetical protein